MWRGVLVGMTVAVVAPWIVGCGGGSDGGGQMSFGQQVTKAMGIDSPDIRAKRLIKIAYGQAKANDARGAEETTELAAQACAEITDPAARTTALASLATAQAKIGSSSADTTARKALAAAGEIESAEIKAVMLAKVAKAQGAASDILGAGETLKQAEQLAGSLEDLFGQTLAFSAIASGYAGAKREDQANRVMAEALKVAQSIDDQRKRCEAIAAVASQQYQMGDKETAAKTFDLAMEVAGQIESPYGHAYALADLAERLSKARHHTDAHAALKKAEQVTQKIPEEDLRQQMTQRVDKLLFELPKPAPAG